MNLPNKLSLARLCCVPVFMVVLALPAHIMPLWLSGVIGAVIFVAASFTDMLDGRIARSRGLITDFGKLIDPLADKFIVLGALIMLLYRAQTPAWRLWLTVLLTLVLFRELAVTSLRLLVASKSGVAVPAKMIGKIKTVTQMVFIAAILLEPAVYEAVAPASTVARVLPLSGVMLVLTGVMTVWSGIDYVVSLGKYIDPEK